MPVPATPSPVAAKVTKAAPVVRDWILTATIAVAFTAVVCVGMMVYHFRSQLDDPVQVPQLDALKETLRSRPQDESVKETIRTLDLQVRRRYFVQLALTATGSWFAIGGLMVFVLAAKQAAISRREVYLPPLKSQAARKAAAREARRSRWSVAALGATLAAGFVTLAMTAKTNVPRVLGDLDRSTANADSTQHGSANAAPSPAEVRNNWPCFRGPNGSGIAIHTNIPLTWDVNTGSGILWKAPVPAPGPNSPIVWGDRVWLAGGDKTKQEVFCFNAQNGNLVWQRAVPPQNQGIQNWEVPEMAGISASTMATDGQHVFAIFATGILTALDLNGNVVWSKNLGLPDNAMGHASSLAVWQSRLIVQFDQGEADARKSRLFAFEGASGKILWQRPRSVASSWATPIVIEAAGQTQIITLAVPWVIAYSASDGAELWRAECLNGEVAPSPIFEAGVVFAISPGEKLLAIRPDGQGDVTKTHVIWSADENIPDVCSPVSGGGRVFTLTTGGLLSCFDALAGKKQWDHDFGFNCQASPSIVGNRLYLFGEKGEATVVEVSRTFKELARTTMSEKFMASPAFAQNRIFLRGERTLYCIGAREEELLKHAAKSNRTEGEKR